MEVFQDHPCFILDLEGFFINKTFHVRELGYFTWNQEHGRHAFFVSVPYKTLSVKEKRTVNFVISKIHGLSYQPSQTEHAQNPRIVGTLINITVPTLQYCRENRGGLQRRSRGERCLETTEHSFTQSRNSRVSQIRCIEISNPPSTIVTQLRFSCRR